MAAFLSLREVPVSLFGGEPGDIVRSNLVDELLRRSAHQVRQDHNAQVVLGINEHGGARSAGQGKCGMLSAPHRWPTQAIAIDESVEAAIAAIFLRLWFPELLKAALVDQLQFLDRNNPFRQINGRGLDATDREQL